MVRPTIRDVADAAGVSIATVSRALSGARGVTAEHKERVDQAAERLGYRPHAIARALRESKTMVVGMVVPAIDNPFFPRLVGEAEAELRARGLALLLTSSHDDPVLESAQLGMLLERQVDGLLVCACSKTLSGVAIEEAARRVPVVQFDQCADGTTTAFVGIDDASGIVQLVAHARRAGGRRFAFLGGGVQNWSGLRRLRAFEAELAQVDPGARGRIRVGAFTRQFGRMAASELLDSEPEIDVIIGGNDLIAIGALDAARERGLRVPGDLHITGFDDIPGATVSSPALTTIRQPAHQLMATAVELLVQAIDGTDTRGIRRELPVALIERDS